MQLRLIYYYSNGIPDPLLLNFTANRQHNIKWGSSYTYIFIPTLTMKLFSLFLFHATRNWPLSFQPWQREEQGVSFFHRASVNLIKCKAYHLLHWPQNCRGLKRLFFILMFGLDRLLLEPDGTQEMFISFRIIRLKQKKKILTWRVITVDTEIWV